MVAESQSQAGLATNAFASSRLLVRNPAIHRGYVRLIYLLANANYIPKDGRQILH